MTNSDNLEDRLAALRQEWPVKSMVDDVMARLPSHESVPHQRKRRRWFAGLISSGLILVMGIAWIVIITRPQTLLAAIQNDLKNAQSAHMVITHWQDPAKPERCEIWYRRDVGVKVVAPDKTYVEDGKTQWSWVTNDTKKPLVVLRQKSPGFFTNQLPGLLALQDLSDVEEKVRSPKLDKEINGQKCQATLFRHKDNTALRGIVLADLNGRIHEITLEEKGKNGNWGRVRQFQIDYDSPVPPEKTEARLPDGAKIVDPSEAFYGSFPLEKALKKVEIDGLILAVHDIQPLKDKEGFYVVSSVRGSDKFLKDFPPSVRPLNPEVVLLDVAFQPGSNMTQGGRFHRIVLGNMARDGVEYSWWMVFPRRYYQMKDGKKSDLAKSDTSHLAGEPGRVDALKGKASLPLEATFYGVNHRDAKGVQKQVSQWVEVDLPGNSSPATLETVTSRARKDILLMSAGGAGGLLGVTAEAKGAPNTLRPLSGIPFEVSDAEFAAAVRRGLDDLRQFDEVKDVDPATMFPPNGLGK